MSALLFGVAPGDPATFATGVGVALLTALAGSLVPALRAVRVTPISVLRAEWCWAGEPQLSCVE
jgi:hypothetical protein